MGDDMGNYCAQPARWPRTAVAAAVLVALTLATLPLAGSTAAAEDQPLFNDPGGDSADIEYATVQVGPFDLDPRGTGHWQDEGDAAVPKPSIDNPDVPYWALKSATFDLVDNTGTPIPRHDVHLHHFVIATVGADDPACPGRTMDGYKVWPHLASGAERTPITLPDPYAMKVWDSEVWGATWHLMNMSNEPQQVWVKYTIGYDPDATNENTRWATPWFMDVTTQDGVPASCGGAEYDVPGGGGSGSEHHRTRTWEIPFDGLMVGSGGHLHEGGLATEIYDSEDRLLCRSSAVYDTSGASARRPPFEGVVPCAMHHRVEAGDELTLHSIYDNSIPWAAVMGINLTFFWWGDQTTGLDPFPDVAGSHPFFTEIAWAADRGITTGYPDGTFRPAAEVTRQAYIAFLYRLAGDASVPADAPDRVAEGFSDVPPSHPFATEIAWAAERGITTGYPERHLPANGHRHPPGGGSDAPSPRGRGHTGSSEHGTRRPGALPRCRARAPLPGRHRMGGQERHHDRIRRRHLPAVAPNHPPGRVGHDLPGCCPMVGAPLAAVLELVVRLVTIPTR